MVCQDHLILNDLTYLVCIFILFMYLFLFSLFFHFYPTQNEFKLRDKLKLLQDRTLVTKMGRGEGKGTEIGMKNQIVLK